MFGGFGCPVRVEPTIPRPDGLMPPEAAPVRTETVNGACAPADREAVP